MRGTTRLRVLFVLMLTGVFFACRDQRTEPDAGAPDTGPVGATGGGSAPRCEVDFPCTMKFQCVGAAQWRALHTIDCSEICGDRPCSGGRCEAIGDIIDCPIGQVCNYGDSNLHSECRPILDGGLCKYLEDGAVDLPGCIPPWGCGDGKLDRGEACDDSNRNDGDGCDHNCQVEE